MLREQPVEIRATAAWSISRHTKLGCHTDLGAFQQYNDTGNSEGTFPPCSLLTALCMCWRQRHLCQASFQVRKLKEMLPQPSHPLGADANSPALSPQPPLSTVVENLPLGV